MMLSELYTSKQNTTIKLNGMSFCHVMVKFALLLTAYISRKMSAIYDKIIMNVLTLQKLHYQNLVPYGTAVQFGYDSIVPMQ